jgi:uncharacterized protein YdhG (YjbR/CyaY superfamily)
MEGETIVKTRPKSVDGYLAALEEGKRAALEKLRKDIHTAAPKAEECISYGMPAFRLDGRMLVWFGAASNHCSFYPGAVVQAHAKELKGYDTSKGTIRFRPDHPLPASLVTKLVRTRARENAAAAVKRHQGSGRSAEGGKNG